MARCRLPWIQTKNGISLKGPVAWLLSRQLISKLRDIGLSTLHGDKLDHRDWMQGDRIDFSAEGEGGEFWFDYISDTGDGQLAVYNIAYLAMSDLGIPGPNVHPGPNLAAPARPGDAGYLLPRGSFLFVGGDAGYHIADRGTLAQHFQTPFNWAYDEIFGATEAPPPVTRRPIIAIPANHDYYDSLDGFSRQFRKTLDPEPYNTDPKEGPQLCLKGFFRVQNASYVALRLPFGWWLWGLDSQNGKIDKRQAEFFKNQGHAAGESSVPDKLVVATPEPSTVFGRWMPPDHEMVKTFDKLGLAPSFLEANHGMLPQNQCRLDISGDIHHYARHWGQGSEADPGKNRSPGTNRSNYASVVAGGGGAFLHPTYTNIDQVRTNRLYPEPLASFQLIVRRLLNPWIIAKGGLVWLAGALVALYAYFAVTVPESTWALFSRYSWFQIVAEGVRPTDGLLGRIRLGLAVEGSMNLWDLLALLFTSRYFFEVLYVGFLGWFFVKKVVPEVAALRHDLGSAEEVWRRRLFTFIGRCFLAGLPLVLLLGWLDDAGAKSTVLSGVLVLAYLGISYLSLKTSLAYSNLLVDRAVEVDAAGRVYNVSICDVVPQWAFVVFSIISAWYGLWHFGDARLSVMVTEAFLVVLLALLIGGLHGLATGIGSQLLTTREDRATLSLSGHWHWVLQLLVPLLLVLYGGWLAFFLTLTVVAVAGFLLNRYVRDLKPEDLARDKRGVAEKILLAWFALGGLVLLIGVASGIFGGGAEPVTFCRMFIVAPLVGALFSCVWLEWYLMVTALYDGHNNEAGGGSLAAAFRHLVRVRLTPDALTAYVIGIDEPRDLDSGSSERTFRLVDVFTIGR